MRMASCYVFLLIALASVQPARAQWAVVDAPAIVQLVQEVRALEEQVQTAHQQLTQAQQALATMTGDRGMERLLNGTARNYLPSSWTQLMTVMQGGVGNYSGIATDVRVAVGANAVLSPQQLAPLSAVDRAQIVAARQATALQQALAKQSLANVSDRFASLQTLVSAISSATDQKAILDLQARIGAELGMLQNEQTKQQILHAALQAEDAVMRQQQLEQVVVAQGQFATRFQPVP